MNANEVAGEEVGNLVFQPLLKAIWNVFSRIIFVAFITLIPPNNKKKIFPFVNREITGSYIIQTISHIRLISIPFQRNDSNWE